MMCNYFLESQYKTPSFFFFFSQSKWMKMDERKIAFVQMLDHELHTSILETLLLFILPT
jgi:ribonucleotide reductase beta subunit family protein with ferritin-like domain